jgi:hypothetical protein
MPYNVLQCRISEFAFFCGIFRNLQHVDSTIWHVWRMKQLTIGNHPTTWPLPNPSPFRISTGKVAHQTTTGYPLVVPWDNSFILSA